MSSNTGHIMTLANSIIGVGILAMPFCFQKVKDAFQLIAYLCFHRFFSHDFDVTLLIEFMHFSVAFCYQYSYSSQAV